MRILVLSDSHGDIAALRKAYEQQPGAELVIFLGDGERDVDMLPTDKPLIKVRGNCDFYSEAPELVINEEKGVRLYCTHGYREHVKYGTGTLLEAARSNNAHIALYGHTHQPVTSYFDGIHLVNPGSVRQGSYAVIDITDSGIMPVLMKIRY